MRENTDAESRSVALRWLTGSTGPLTLALLNCRGSKEKTEMIKIILSIVFVLLIGPRGVFAQTYFLHSYSGTSSTQLAVWAAKDLNLFSKYRLDVDFVFIPGGARGMQALMGGSTHSSDTDGVAPVHAIARGGDAVIVAGLNNRTLFKFVSQKEITDASQLRKKRIGVANFGGSNEFAVIMALKEWNIPREAVTLVAAGGSAVRLAAMEKGGLDATVLPYDQALMATRLGMRVLADIPDLVPNFPDKVITMRRSFVQKERETAKRFLQAVSEAIYQVSISAEKGTSVLRKRLAVKDPKIIEENYNVYGRIFAFPPRVGRKGLEGVLEQVQLQTGAPKADFEVERFLDESIIDELEREGFFKKISSDRSR
jgi:NitT/TauT family transport system substrate-binding protein